MHINILEHRTLLSTGAGSLDQSFGDHGIVETNLGSEVRINAMAAQKDGRMVLAGTSDQFGTKSDFFITRRLADGSTDSTFGDDGVVTTDFLGGNEEASSVFIQNDGRIVVAGGAKKLFAVARYNINGSSDKTFGNNGTKLINFGKASSVAQAMTLQSDGRILIVGGSNIVRLTTQGKLDRTFSNDGKASLGNVFGDAWTLAVNPKDGSIVVGGEQSDTSRNSTSGVITKVKSNGTIDLNFAKGFVKSSVNRVYEASNSKPGYLSFGNELPNSLKIASDGKIVFAGYRNFGERTIGEVFRISADGKSVKLLGNADTQQTQDISANDVFIQPDGRIVAAFEMYGDAGRIGLARFNIDGSRDVSFGYKGISQTETLTVTQNDLAPVAIAQGPGSQLLVLSQTYLYTTVQRYDAGKGAFKADFTLTSGRLDIKGTSRADHVDAFVDQENVGRGYLRLNNEAFDIAPTRFGTIRGGGGDDTLVATSFTFNPTQPIGAVGVQIFGDDGDDTIYAFIEDGGALVRGGKGDDAINASDQNDSLYGEDGNDTILGGEGGDTIDGGKGNDNLQGEDGDDLFAAKDGVTDLVDGGPGNDTAKVDKASVIDQLTDVESVSS